MTPTLKDSDAIDKTGPRRPIVLRTLPPLSFSTPTHSVSIQLSFGSGAVSTLKPLDMAAIQPPLSALGNYSTRSSVERLDSPLFEEQITLSNVANFAILGHLRPSLPGHVRVPPNRPIHARLSRRVVANSPQPLVQPVDPQRVHQNQEPRYPERLHRGCRNRRHRA
ncbi:hypothetical protein C8Q79DRAFT_238867 [Trametes meyenii]|nr:hypothetical protein C8Q79DRAFT_238867 [Trametes meyenii]